MQGKTVVITGATSGIGEVAALALARKGARIVLVARDRERALGTLDKLNRVNPVAHAAHYADLSRISEMKRVASEIAAAEPVIDVLINNAGALYNHRQVTEDGLERTFATNHMAYYVMTLSLLPNLKAARAGRVVVTASDAHRGQVLDFSNLQFERGFKGFKVYCRSKLANILFTRELAKRLAGGNVTANSLHPGFVATRFGDESGGWFAGAVWIAKFTAISKEAGARTIIYLASSPEVEGRSGGYYYECKPHNPTAGALDDGAARNLWDVSAKISGVDLTL